MSGRIEEWPDAFASKLMPAAEAAKLVQSGDTICIPTGALVPTVNDVGPVAPVDETWHERGT